MMNKKVDNFWVWAGVGKLFAKQFTNPAGILTVSISLNQQLAIEAKSYFWTKFFLQPPETIKTPK
jgi:hypothetical protein